MPAPCDDWATVDEVRSCSPAPQQDDDEVQVAIEAAQEWLWAQSGRQFGVCSVTVRPTSEQFVACDTWWMLDYWRNRLGASYSSTGYLFWDGMACSCCLGENYVQSSSCGATPAISLGYAPIVAVQEVKIDGAVLAPSSYEVVDGEYLMRTDGQLWPCCQVRTDPTTEANTWSVTLTYGTAIPALGSLATRALARFLLSLCGSADGCTPPPVGVQTLTRQGMVVEMPDPGEIFSGVGHTGIGPVDAFIGVTNPNRLQKRSVAVIPGMTPYSTRA